MATVTSGSPGLGRVRRSDLPTQSLKFFGPVNSETIQGVADGDFGVVRSVMIPEGVYDDLSGFIVAADSDLKQIVLAGDVTITVPSTTDAFGWWIRSNDTRIFGGRLLLHSAGTKTDGNNVRGMLVGSSTMENVSHFYADWVEAEDCSGTGLQVRAVAGEVGHFEALNCDIGLHLGGTAGANSTVLVCGKSYLTGCRRGTFVEQVTTAWLQNQTWEYCGATGTNDGALHLKNALAVKIDTPYWEANYRNRVIDESQAFQVGGTEFAGTAADYIAYVGLAYSDRGYSTLDHTTLRIQKLLAEPLGATPGRIATVDEIEFMTAGDGVFLKSPDGTRYRLTIADGGTVAVTAAP